MTRCDNNALQNAIGNPNRLGPRSVKGETMKKLLALAAVALTLGGCAVYHDRGGYYDDGYKKPHPHGCPPGQAKKGNC